MSYSITPPRCAGCSRPTSQHRSGLIPVVDETGSASYCSLCLLDVLARFERTGDVTVVVSRPAVSR